MMLFAQTLVHSNRLEFDPEQFFMFWSAFSQWFVAPFLLAWIYCFIGWSCEKSSHDKDNTDWSNQYNALKDISDKMRIQLDTKFPPPPPSIVHPAVALMQEYKTGVENIIQLQVDQGISGDFAEEITAFTNGMEKLLTFAKGTEHENQRAQDRDGSRGTELLRDRPAQPGRGVGEPSQELLQTRQEIG